MSIKDKLKGKTTKLSLPRAERNDHPASPNYQDGNYYTIEIDSVSPDPNQPRKHFDPESLAELSLSIKQKGVLQPVIIRKDGETIWLVAGERRYRAAKMAGLEKIPAILTTGNPAEIALIENLQRENLKPIEESEALARIMTEFNYTHEQLALVVGKARTTITETLSLNKLPEEIKDECRRADIFPRRLLIEISKQESPEAMLELLRRVKEGNLKSDGVRQLTRKKQERKKNDQAQVILRKVEDLDRSIAKLDLAGLEDETRLILIQRLTALRKRLAKVLK